MLGTHAGEAGFPTAPRIAQRRGNGGPPEIFSSGFILRLPNEIVVGGYSGVRKAMRLVALQRLHGNIFR